MALTRVSRHIIDEPLELQNINATGIGTFASLRVTGDLQVDGTTTTLDTVVTSVDRLEVGANNSTVGVAITQSGTGDIFNLYDGSNKEFSVTDGGTVKISQSMAFQQSDRATTAGLLGRGSLLIAGTQQTDFAIRSAPHDSNLILGVGVTERLRITSGGVVGINTDVSNNPSGSKLVVGGRIQSNAGGYWFAGANGAEDGWHVQDSGGNLLVVESGVAERLRITSDGKVRVPDNGKFVAGDGDDLEIYHNPSSGSFIDNTGNVTLALRQFNNDSDIVLSTDDGSGGVTPYIRCDGSEGSVILSHYGNTKLETKSTGIQVTGQIDIGTTSIYGTGDISMGDSDKLRLGAGDDLRIYHNGSHSYIDETGDGNLYIRNGTKNSIFARTDGEVILYHDNNNRLETTNTGASVTGNLNISGHTYLNDNRELVIGAGNDLKLYHDATNSYIDNATGDLWIRADGDDLNLRAADNISLLVQNNHNGINVYGEGPVDLYHNNIHRFQTTATGAKVFGALEVTQEYPTIRPTLDLNFAATKTLDRRITFTRDSLGTYVGEDGLVKYASNNVPRFDHDPATGESLGLLVEESRTNDFAHSDPANAAWVGDNGAIKTANTTDTAAPDGSFTALKLASQANANSYSQIYDNLSKSSGGIQSLWAKKGTHNVIGIYDYSGSAGIRGWFDLNTGEHRCEGGSKVAAGVQSNGNDNNNTNMVEYPNGWYRCIYYEAANMTYAHLRICDFDSDAEASSSSNTIYLWGLQAELNKTFATSFIPSLSGTMPATNSTREVDNFKISGTNFESFINKTEGTMMMEYKNLSSAVNTGLPTIGDGTHSRYMMFNLGTDTQFSAATVNGGVVQANPSVNITSSSSQFAKAIYAVKENDFAITANGQTPVTDTSGTLFTTPTQFTLEYGAGGNDPNAHFKSIKYYPKRLPNAQLQGLTQQ